MTLAERIAYAKRLLANRRMRIESRRFDYLQKHFSYAIQSHNARTERTS